MNDDHTPCHALDVSRFFAIAGQTVGARPHVPDDKTVRLRLRLIAEEFFELLHASLGMGTRVKAIESFTLDVIDHSPIMVDLPEFADATIDLDYVVEGARLAFGINGEPLWDAVHAANMAKMGGPKDPQTGKQLKPPGWTAPPIQELLMAQGWEP
jgi:predicted HAD superfamily Cof-like phosphohydrolase